MTGRCATLIRMSDHVSTLRIDGPDGATHAEERRLKHPADAEAAVGAADAALVQCGFAVVGSWWRLGTETETWSVEIAPERLHATVGPEILIPTRPDAGQELADLQSYDDLVARIYADHPPAEIRELALALAWAVLRDPHRHDPAAGKVLKRVAVLLGRDGSGQWRHKLAFSADAPRYEPPRGFHIRTGGACIGPRVRPYRPRGSAAAPVPAAESGRPLVCGAPSAVVIEERDLATGQISALHRYCRRHRDLAEQVRSRISDRGTPLHPPVPNSGGWLPRYFAPDSLEVHYAWARPQWTVPTAGLCRDDWTTADIVKLVPRRARLALVVSR